MAMVLVPSALLASPKVDCGKAAVRISCFCNSRSEGVRKTKSHEPRVFDNLFLSLFRNKMVQETGWDSEKPGYEGLIEVAHRLTLAQDNSQTRDAAVRILRSLFPPLLLELYRMLVAPIDSGKFAALMVARVTALSCQWLMGPCTVNSVDLPHGPSLMSGVFVEKCKYLEESKCVGVCINTCKLPTQEQKKQSYRCSRCFDAEPVNMAEHEVIETEAPSWVNSHILELSNTYGVAFEGFQKETLELLMRIDDRKMMLESKSQEKLTKTPRSRGIGKNELKNLQSSLNKEVEGARNRGRVLSLTYK